ncbi:hypothetical protein SISSUDRAFT_1065846 [Sistotremastrum suecicum HHB10207 ss-3]|uniref:Uncharacterized protein n=1 Tax=Sistotremastrum suecicum HHB10207 ss-3 TaxID=1314776 RepID=A0A165Z0X6_9AGAM|nr:hypothetical protein SISSUDRAFT_1065846 [Sistotremastrum suecicum HHB10207 ss-3]
MDSHSQGTVVSYERKDPITFNRKGGQPGIPLTDHASGTPAALTGAYEVIMDDSAVYFQPESVLLAFHWDGWSDQFERKIELYGCQKLHIAWQIYCQTYTFHKVAKDNFSSESPFQLDNLLLISLHNVGPGLWHPEFKFINYSPEPSLKAADITVHGSRADDDSGRRIRQARNQIAGSPYSSSSAKRKVSARANTSQLTEEIPQNAVENSYYGYHVPAEMVSVWDSGIEVPTVPDTATTVPSSGSSTANGRPFHEQILNPSTMEPSKRPSRYSARTSHSVESHSHPPQPHHTHNTKNAQTIVSIPSSSLSQWNDVGYPPELHPQGQKSSKISGMEPSAELHGGAYVQGSRPSDDFDGTFVASNSSPSSQTLGSAISPPVGEQQRHHHQHQGTSSAQSPALFFAASDDSVSHSGTLDMTTYLEQDMPSSFMNTPSLIFGDGTPSETTMNTPPQGTHSGEMGTPGLHSDALLAAETSCGPNLDDFTSTSDASSALRTRVDYSETGQLQAMAEMPSMQEMLAAWATIERQRSAMLKLQAGIVIRP